MLRTLILPAVAALCLVAGCGGGNTTIIETAAPTTAATSVPTATVTTTETATSAAGSDPAASLRPGESLCAVPEEGNKAVAPGVGYLAVKGLDCGRALLLLGQLNRTGKVEGFTCVGASGFECTSEDGSSGFRLIRTGYTQCQPGYHRVGMDACAPNE